MYIDFSVLIVKAADFSEKLLYLYKYTWLQIPDLDFFCKVSACIGISHLSLEHKQRS
jgi:hypothetical protein